MNPNTSLLKGRNPCPGICGLITAPRKPHLDCVSLPPLLSNSTFLLNGVDISSSLLLLVHEFPLVSLLKLSRYQMYSQLEVGSCAVHATFPNIIRATNYNLCNLCRICESPDIYNSFLLVVPSIREARPLTIVLVRGIWGL